MLCPRCDGQGSIYQALIIEKKLTIYLCDECEATWLDYKFINHKYFLDFTTLMRTMGFRGLWTELDQIKEDWEKKGK